MAMGFELGWVRFTTFWAQLGYESSTIFCKRKIVAFLYIKFIIFRGPLQDAVDLN